MTRVGLVLGAGGLVGQAFHAGVLAALEQDLGWDPRTADVVVGTSAGSLTGTALRAGVPAQDLAARSVGADLSEEGRLLEAVVPRDHGLPPLAVRDLFRPWRLPSAPLLGRVARRPWSIRPAAMAMTLLPTGRVDLAPLAEPLRRLLGAEWPPGLRICAARRSDTERVVFGQAGSPPTSLTAAVLASCAIPGYFRPVDIGGVTYFDGGVYSPTNADAVGDADLDLVVVSSPMSAARGRARTPDAGLRWSAHRRLLREIRPLEATGTTVVVFEPTPPVLAHMGTNAMAADRADRVMRSAFFATGARAASGATAERLAPLATRHSRRLCS